VVLPEGKTLTSKLSSLGAAFFVVFLSFTFEEGIEQ